MVKILRLAVLLLVVAGMAGIVIPAYSQEKAEEQKIASVSGEVVSVDLEKSTVVIKAIKDPIAKTYEDITISVLPETKLAKADVSLKLSDIKAGDKVVVGYVTDTLGKWIIKNISVEAKEAAPVK